MSTQNTSHEHLSMKGKPHPLEHTSLLGSVWFSWLSPYMNIIDQTSFEQSMHPNLKEIDSSTVNAKLLADAFRTTQKIYSSLWILYRCRYILLILSIFFCSLLYGAKTMAIFYIVQNMQKELTEDGNFRNKQLLCGLVTLLAGLILLEDVTMTHVNFQKERISIISRAAVYNLIYEKILKLRLLNPDDVDQSKIINLVQIDSERFISIHTSIMALLSAGLNLFMSLGLGVCFFGWKFFLLGLFCLITMFPLAILSRVLSHLSYQYSILKDNTMKIFKNMYGNIRFIKSRALEHEALKKIYLSRLIELSLLLKYSYLNGLMVFVSTVGPGASIFGFLWIYLKTQDEIQLSHVAILIRIIIEISRIIEILSWCIGYLIDLSVGVDRINSALNSDSIDIDLIKNKRTPRDQLADVEIYKTVFYWKAKSTGGNEKKLQQPTDKHSVKTGPENNSSKKERSEGLRLLDEEESGFELSTELLPPSTFTLRIDNFSAHKKKLTFLIGSIGSGKSTLLYSLMGETRHASSQPGLFVYGNIGFVGQKPWIINTTVKRNILLNRELDQKRLEWSLKFSCLQDDLQAFENGLEQETGEAGDALSGGQKIRLALARCLYQNPDIYLFDDVVSALDTHVGSFIMEQTILRELRGKTIVMSTHAVQYLKYADLIYLLEKGTIIEQGSFEKVSKCRMYQHFLQLNKEFFQKTDEQKNQQQTKTLDKTPLVNHNQLIAAELIKSTVQTDDQFTKKLMLPEDRQIGEISQTTYSTFFKLFGGFFAVLLIITLGVAQFAMKIMSNLLLTTWSKDPLKENKNSMMIMYLTYNVWSAALNFANTVIIGYLCYRLLGVISMKMIATLFHSRIEQFIARIPSGRIIGRFSRDLFIIDKKGFYYTLLTLAYLSQLVVSLFIFAFFIGLRSIIFVILMILINLYLQIKSMKSKREFIRLQSISRTPILSLFSDTCRGLPEIRSLKLEEYFIKRFRERTDDVIKNEITIEGLTAWYSMRASVVITLVLVLPTLLLMVLFGTDVGVEKLLISVVLSTTLGFEINLLLNSYGLFESLMIAVERCDHFEKIEPEKNYKSFTKDLQTLDGTLKSLKSVMESELQKREKLVTEGLIQFRRVTCKYPTSSTPVLSSLSFEVLPREKVGVIGRTGSGKTTLIKLLWRALDVTEGEILIDRSPIHTADLKSLRSQVALVTQETALIEGSLRENIDLRLSDGSRDSELLAVLQKLDFSHSSFLEKGLDMKIEQDGSNLSLGEKQLISFARTLLDSKRIIILDEATASIDITSEQKIQQCIEKEFADSTMLIIAHRVQTIMNCDKILVLDKGRLVAFDSPSNLLRQRDPFSSIIDKMSK